MPNGAATPATAPPTPVTANPTVVVTPTPAGTPTPDAAATPVAAPPAAWKTPADWESREVIHLTLETVAISAKMVKCTKEICDEDYTGPMPMNGDLTSAITDKPTDDWISKVIIKFHCLTKLVLQLNYYYKLEKLGPPKVGAGKKKEARAETAARRLGFLPKGPTHGSYHCGYGIKKWMPELSHSSFIPILNCIECLLGSELDVPTRNTNLAKVRYVSSVVATNEDEKKVMLKIIEEMAE